MYQLILESFLGFKREGDTLRFEPCVPLAWESFTIHYRFQDTVYSIQVLLELNDITTVSLDGNQLKKNVLPLINDKGNHTVIFSVGTKRNENVEMGSSKTVENFPNNTP
jgi:cellobiose phosphorylase